MHHPDCDVNDPNIEGIRKPCNCPPGWSGGPTTDTAGPVGSLAVPIGSPLLDGLQEEIWRADAGWSEVRRLRAALVELEDLARNRNTTRQQLRDRLQAILANNFDQPTPAE